MGKIYMQKGVVKNFIYGPNSYYISHYLREKMFFYWRIAFIVHMGRTHLKLPLITAVFFSLIFYSRDLAWGPVLHKIISRRQIEFQKNW